MIMVEQINLGSQTICPHFT